MEANIFFTESFADFIVFFHGVTQGSSVWGIVLKYINAPKMFVTPNLLALAVPEFYRGVIPI